MLPIQLSAADTALWNSDPSWKAGFLLGLQLALETQPEVSLVVVQDNNGTTLQQYQRTWSIA